MQDSLHFPYQSKLGEFEEFTARAKLPALTLAPSAAAVAVSSPARPSQSQPHSLQHQPGASQQQPPSQPGDAANGTAQVRSALSLRSSAKAFQTSGRIACMHQRDRQTSCSDLQTAVTCA